MNQLLSNKIIAGIVALALLVGVGVVISSGDISSTTRNAALVVATPCTKPGQVTKVSKQSVVCAKTNTGSLWYATMKAKGKAQACAKPGAIRKKSKIVWVCGVVKKKKLWQATQPLTALAAKGDLPSTTPATPDAPVNADNAVLADPAVIDTAATQTLAPAVPTALSLVAQPSGGVNALALETQPVVQLLDQRGASISTAGITIVAVSGRTDVVLSGNTAVTDATGRATFTTLSLTGIMGDIALTFTAPRLGLEGVTSGNLDLAAGVATKLVSDTKLGAVAAGQQFNQFHKLHLEDSSGNVVAISGRDVIVSSSPEGLSGTTTVATAKDGYVLFKELTLTQTGATTLTFTSGDLITTSTVMVKPGDSKGLKITTEASEAATNNIAFAQSPVVQLLDADGNNVTTAGITVTATITQFSAGATATTSTLFVSTGVTNAQGVATFTGLGIKGLIGTYTLGFTPAGGVTRASDKTVTLKSGDLKKLIVLTAAAGPVGNSTAGTWSLTQSPMIGLLDISNNEVTKSGVTVTATMTGQDPTFSAVTDDQGKATFPIIFSGNDAGLRTITYKASNVNIDLTADITLPFLAPVVNQHVAYPPTPSTTSPAFIPTTFPTSNSTTGVWGYTSSNEAIATVDSAGSVTPGGAAGEVTITATQAETTKYAGGAKSEAKIVIARTSTVVNQAVAYSNIPYKTTSEPFLPTRLPTSNSTTGVWGYTSSNEAIATVDYAGKVRPRGVAGKVTITATQAETPMYAGGGTSFFELTIVRTPTAVTRNVSYEFDKNTYSFLPTRLPTSNSDGVWTYTSSSEAIAPVDATTGNVIPSASVAGTVTITATQAETPKYASATSTYTGTYQTIIGKTGPGGGKVFYAAATPQPWGRYLEAAPTDYQVNGLRIRAKWSCRSTDGLSFFQYTKPSAIGSGKANTDKLLTECTTAGTAADVANKYSTTSIPNAPGAAGQWFLPSKDELNEMWVKKVPIGGFSSYIYGAYYWSSSMPGSIDDASFQNFTDGTQHDWGDGYWGNSEYYVRPVRAF